MAGSPSKDDDDGDKDASTSMMMLPVHPVLKSDAPVEPVKSQLNPMFRRMNVTAPSSQPFVASISPFAPICAFGGRRLKARAILVRQLLASFKI